MSRCEQEVQKYLEAVYAVAPVPGEYVRYRLHLATALPLDLLDAWFDMRRKTSMYNQDVIPNNSSTGAIIPVVLSFDFGYTILCILKGT